MRAAKNQHGFTLIELVVTTTFLAIAVVAVATTFAFIDRLNARARNIASVTQLAQIKIEDFRNRSYNAIDVGTQDFSAELPGFLESPKAASAVVTQAEEGLKRVDVSIDYMERGQGRQVKVSTFVTQRGINR